jgi:superfamily II DNA or RNA helicase/predicted nucleic acid-binding Zn finger protein
MIDLTTEFIRKKVAFSDIIYDRGRRLYENGSYMCAEADFDKGWFVYDVDGTYGDYTTKVQLLSAGVNSACDCPYPGKGCKHTVAVLLDIYDRIMGWNDALKKTAPPKKETPEPETATVDEEQYLTFEEIRQQALEDRKLRARQEEFKVTLGEMYKGEHLVETPKGRQYVVTLHDPMDGRGHCSCPDYATNRLGTCKHLIYLTNYVKKQKNIKSRVEIERFPFVDIYWDSTNDSLKLFCERPKSEIGEILEVISDYFDSQGLFYRDKISEFPLFLARLNGNKRVRIQENTLKRIDDHLQEEQLAGLSNSDILPMSMIKTRLYPYQEEGIKFSLFKRGSLIGDEMGLGKTLQAIALAIMKKEVFGFNKVVVITMASLKEQWKREIERFTGEKAIVIAGTQQQRENGYMDSAFFKITNYEAVLRDVSILSRFKPDLVILDEAQRIKNFTTKTADAVKSIPRNHSLVLTGTPLENKLEDVYSIVQFLDSQLLAPLWKFAADHFMLSRSKKGRILGYRNLDLLKERLKPIVIRRRKEEVLKDLPEELVNNYYLDLSEKQEKMHQGFLSMLLPLINKKYLTPMDIRRMQELLLNMRRVCDSTYLIDRKTNISPKLKELAGIIDELVLQNDRKVVIFSEWTTMTFLIGKQLSKAGISFVELTGKVPVTKRQALIDEFTNNPACKVFLSTDAGGTGLNLQAADCVINFELPWNPSRMNQRIGRVSRIGQVSRCINVVNLICKRSIEEKILAGIQMKTDLFQGVFDDGPDVVEFSREKRTELINKLREMMGDEPEPISTEPRPQEEIPQDTPHFLNPAVLQELENQEKEQTVAYEAEEHVAEAPPDTVSSQNIDESGTMSGARGFESPGAFLSGRNPDKVENVLNSGMQFLSGLMEMATGQKIIATADDARMIQIDKETGEVTMKFKLPGF